MARVCSICGSGKRLAVDQAVSSGESYRHTATRLGLSETSIRRHVRHHLAVRVREAAADRDRLHAMGLLDRYVALLDDVTIMRAVAIDGNDIKAAVQAVAVEARLLDTLRSHLGLTDLTITTAVAEMKSVGRALTNLIDSHPEAVAALAADLAAQGAAGADTMAAAIRTRLERASAPSALPATRNDNASEPRTI